MTSPSSNQGGWYSMFGWSDPDVKPSLLSRAKHKASKAQEMDPTRGHPSSFVSKAHQKTSTSWAEAREAEVEVSPTVNSGFHLIQPTSGTSGHNDLSFDSGALAEANVAAMGGPHDRGLRGVPRWESLDEGDEAHSPTSIMYVEQHETNSNPSCDTPRKQLFGGGPMNEKLQKQRRSKAKSAIESSSQIDASLAARAMSQLDARSAKPREEAPEEEPSSSFSFWGVSNWEAEAQTAFTSPSAMAAKRLGRRKIQPLGEDQTVYSSIPKRYQPSVNRDRDNPKSRDFLKSKMKEALQVSNTAGSLVPDATTLLKLPMNKARSKNGANSSLPPPTEVQYNEEEIKMLKEIRHRQATKIALLTQPHVRRHQQRRHYLQMGKATLKIQRVFRTYREEKRQHRIHSEELKKRAAKASRRAHARQRDKTVLERQNEAAVLICRLIWDYHQRTAKARKATFQEERRLAQQSFETQKRDWAAQVLCRSWRYYKSRCTARQGRIVLRRQRVKAALIILCALQYNHAVKEEERELRAWASLVVYRVLALHFAKRVLQRRIRNRNATIVLQRLCKRFNFFYALERRIIIRRYHRMGYAACTLQRAMKRYHAVLQLEKRIRERKLRNRSSSVITRAISLHVQRRHHAAFIIACALSAYGQLRNKAARTVTRAIAEYALVRQYSALIITHAMNNYRFKCVLFRRTVAHRIRAGQLVAEQQDQASTTISRVFKRHHAILVMEQRLQEQVKRNKAARIITCAFARNRFKSIVERNLIRQYVHWAADVVTRLFKRHRFLRVLERKVDDRRIRVYVHWAARTVTRAFLRNRFLCALDRRMAQRRARLELDRAARTVTRAMSRNRFVCVMDRRMKDRQVRLYYEWAARTVARLFVRNHFLCVMERRIEERRVRYYEWAVKTVARALIRNHFLLEMERRIHARRTARAQRIYRGLSQQCALRVLKRRMERKELVRQKAAARVIQRNWRPLYTQVKAANCIRRSWKCHKFNRALEAKFQEMKAARVKVNAKNRFRAMARRRTQSVLNRRGVRASPVDKA